MIYTGRPPVRAARPAGGALQLQGVGFKVFATPGRLALQVGYSHYLVVATPVGSAVRARRQQVALVGAALADRVARLRRPDPYKGRGVYPYGGRPPLKPGKRR